MSVSKVKTAIIGLGRWGSNVARELNTQSDLVGYVTRSGSVSEEFKKAAPMALEAVCADKEIKAIAVATPIATHTAIVRTLLETDKHVLCEKPLGTSSVEAAELARLAQERGLLLMTGYVFLYHPVYGELKKALSSEEISHIEMQWEKYGTFGEPIEFNLLTHHLSIALDLGGFPKTVRIKHGTARESACDIVDTYLSYDRFEVHSHIDRLSQQNSHVLAVTCESGNVYTWKGSRLFRWSVGSPEKEIFSSDEQALATELHAFLTYAEGGEIPSSASGFAADVLKILESATE